MTDSEKYMKMITALESFLDSTVEFVSKLKQAKEIMSAGLLNDDKSQKLISRTETMLDSAAEITETGGNLIDSLQATYINLKAYEEK